METKSPNRNNVDLGDLLLATGIHGRSTILPIYRIEDNLVYGRLQDDDNGHFTSTSYGEAVVLKQDGTYLVGESILKHLQSFGPQE